MSTANLCPACGDSRRCRWCRVEAALSLALHASVLGAAPALAVAELGGWPVLAYPFTMLLAVAALRAVRGGP